MNPFKCQFFSHFFCHQTIIWNYIYDNNNYIYGWQASVAILNFGSVHGKKKVFQLKFIYSEKATKFCKISILLLKTVHTVKSKMEISQDFVDFSEYMNFNWPLVIFPSSLTISIAWTAFYITTHDYDCKQYSKCHTDNKDDTSSLRKKIHFRIIRGEAWATTKYAICIKLFHINLFCHIFRMDDIFLHRSILLRMYYRWAIFSLWEGPNFIRTSFHWVIDTAK